MCEKITGGRAESTFCSGSMSVSATAAMGRVQHAPLDPQRTPRQSALAAPSVLKCLGYMRGRYHLAMRQVRQSSGHLQDPVKRPRRKRQLVHRRAQKRPPRIIEEELAKLAHLNGAHLRIRRQP